MEVTALDSGSSSVSTRVLCFLRSPEPDEKGCMLLFQKDGDEIKQEIFVTVNEGGSCAWGGDCVYLIGSPFHLSARVCKFFHQQIRYEGCPPMLLERYRPNTVFLNGKLYVFGGLYMYLSWGEVFNPKDQTWSPLPAPDGLTCYPSDVVTTAVLESENKILLSFDETLDLLAFDVETQEWEIYDKLKDPIPFFGQAVVVDRVLYGCGSRHLYAYHLDTQLTMKTSYGLMGLENGAMFDLPCDEIPSLQHVCGNSFCMFWKLENRPFYYLSFQLSERKNWGGIAQLYAYNLSTGSYQNPYLPPNMSLLWTVRLPDTAKLYDLNKVSFDNKYNEAKDEVMGFRQFSKLSIAGKSSGASKLSVAGESDGVSRGGKEMTLEAASA